MLQPRSLSTLQLRSLRRRACEWIISSFIKEVNTFTNVDLVPCVTLARETFELSSSLEVTFTEVKCMIRMLR